MNDDKRTAQTAKAREAKQRKYHERLAAKLRAAGWVCVAPDAVADTRCVESPEHVD